MRKIKRELPDAANLHQGAISLPKAQGEDHTIQRTKELPTSVSHVYILVYTHRRWGAYVTVFPSVFIYLRVFIFVFERAYSKRRKRVGADEKMSA